MADLKYLFIAEYTDGTLHEQTPEDRSKIDPEKRSEFYDVLQSGKTIKQFSLVGNNHRITVDLTDGHFEVDGFPLLLESEQLPTLPEKFDLLFYRQHTHHTNVEYQALSGNITNAEDAGHEIEYFIGWECTIKGKNYKQKIGVR